MPTPAAEVRDEFCPSVDFSQYSRLEPQGDEEDDLQAWESISQIDQPPWEPEEPSAEALAKIHNWDPPSVPPTPRAEPDPVPEPEHESQTPPPQQRQQVDYWFHRRDLLQGGGKMTATQERRRSMRSVSPRKEARKPVAGAPSPTPPAEPAEETPREATETRDPAGGKMPPNLSLIHISEPTRPY